MGTERTVPEGRELAEERAVVFSQQGGGGGGGETVLGLGEVL